MYISGGLSDTPSDERGIVTDFTKSLELAATRVVCLNLVKPDSKLMGVFSIPTTRVQEVIIAGVVDANVCFRGGMSNLQLMVTPLSVLSVLPPHGALQRLTRLTIYQNNGCYSAQRLTRVLGCTPQLRTLRLKNLIIEEHPTSEVTHTVSLPFLNHLELWGCNRKVAELLELPQKTSILVFFPDFLNDCLAPGFVENLAIAFLPPSFLKSTTLSLNIAPGGGKWTGVDLGVRWNTDGPHCNVRVQLGQNSHSTIHNAACVLACEIFRQLQSVVNLNIHISVLRLPVRLTRYLAGLRNLQILSITGEYMSQVVADMARADPNLLPGLRSVCLGQDLSLPASQAFEGWLASRERAGMPVERVVIPIDVDTV